MFSHFVSELRRQQTLLDSHNMTEHARVSLPKFTSDNIRLIEKFRLIVRISRS